MKKLVLLTILLSILTACGRPDEIAPQPWGSGSAHFPIPPHYVCPENYMFSCPALEKCFCVNENHEKVDPVLVF